MAWGLASSHLKPDSRGGGLRHALSYYVSGIRFGRDRTGHFDDRNPAQFQVLTAVADDVYADGNDSNDASEYPTVLDPATLGFGGKVGTSQTVVAALPPTTKARFLKIRVASLGAPIDTTTAALPRP